MNAHGPDGPSLEDAGNAIHALLNHYHDEVVPTFGQPDQPEKPVVQVALLVRAPPLVEAALTLAEAGFGRETMMLNRPLFELMLDASWAGKNPTLADERFVAHARYTQHLQREVANRYPELGITPGEGRLEPDEIKASSKLFGAYASRSWTGVRTMERIAAFKDRLEPDQEREFQFVFDVLHNWNNGELHPSSWSLARALRRVPAPDGTHKVQFRVGPEPEFAAFALGCTWWVFLQLLDLMHEVANIPTDSLQSVADVGAELLGIASQDQ